MALSKEQKITYLANIVFVARADGKLSPQETESLEEIRKTIGTKKTELNKAFTLAESQDFEMKPTGHWADQVKNLEDIIFVSMVDGIDKVEKKLITDFSVKVNVTPEQFNAIFNDIKNYISREESPSACFNCKTKLTGNVKFCPECGTLIKASIEKQAVSVSYDIPKTGITIEFAESTAAGFAHAVKEQQIAPVNGTCLRAKKTWYLAAWPELDILSAVKLAENLKGMRNRKVYVDGKESKWDEVFGFMWCMNQRDSAYRPLEYCFGLDEKRLNIWGCKQSRMDWNGWGDWFSYGSFKESSSMFKKQVSFKFEKSRISHELETNLFRFRFCPYLRFDLIEAIVKEFPEEVMITKDGLWEFKRDYNESPGALKVIEKSSQDGFTYTDEYYASGVSPKSIKIALEILKKAAESCGFKNSEIKGVLAFKD